MAARPPGVSWILYSSWDIICATFTRKRSGRVRSWFVWFFDRVTSLSGLQFWQDDQDVRDIGQRMTISDNWNCILTFWRTSQANDLGWPHNYLYWLNWRFFFGFPVALRPKRLSVRPHWHIYRTFWTLQISARAIDPVCPQAIFPARVTLFHSRMIKTLQSTGQYTEKRHSDKN